MPLTDQTPATLCDPAGPVTLDEFAKQMTAAGPQPRLPSRRPAARTAWRCFCFCVTGQGRSADRCALTVDHGLRLNRRMRPGRSPVGALLGVSHEVLRWSGEKPAHRVQEEARRARYELMESWCAEHGIENLFVAHTEDDQAETFLFRMSRGSGPAGLAAMPLVLSRPGSDHPAASPIGHNAWKRR